MRILGCLRTSGERFLALSLFWVCFEDTGTPASLTCLIAPPTLFLSGVPQTVVFQALHPRSTIEVTPGSTLQARRPATRPSKG